MDCDVTDSRGEPVTRIYRSGAATVLVLVFPRCFAGAVYTGRWEHSSEGRLGEGETAEDAARRVLDDVGDVVGAEREAHGEGSRWRLVPFEAGSAEVEAASGDDDSRPLGAELAHRGELEE
jgi:hypothetical protein